MPEDDEPPEEPEDPPEEPPLDAGGGDVFVWLGLEPHPAAASARTRTVPATMRRIGLSLEGIMMLLVLREICSSSI